MIPYWISHQLPSNIERGFCSNRFGRMHFLKRGHDQQVVCVHGNPTWSFLWRRVMNELDPKKYEVLAPDLMNLGFSDDFSSKDFTLENHIECMVEFFKKNVRKGAVLVVQDWGGPIGLLAAKRVPELFSGFVILNTGLAAPRLPLRLSTFHRLANMPILAEILFGVFGFPMRRLGGVQADPLSISGEVEAAYRYPIHFGRRLAPLKFARMVPSHAKHPALKHTHELEEFSRSLKNVEVVWGMRDPVLSRQLKRVREILHNPPVTEVVAGHFLQEEAFKEIAQAIERVAGHIPVKRQTSPSDKPTSLPDSALTLHE